MKFSNKSQVSQMNDNIFGVDFHDFLEKEQQSTVYELATEFGLTYHDVHKLKKQLEKM